MTALACAVFAILGGVAGHLAGLRGAGWVTPNAFPRDPYGYATNQAGHMVLGLGMCVLAVLASFVLVDEPPRRWELWLITLAGFGAFELALGGAPGDALEDTVYTIGYGAGASLYTVQWVEGFIFALDFAALLPFAVAAAIHLAAGAAWRAHQRLRATVRR